MTAQFAQAGADTIIITGRNSAPLDETKSSIEASYPGCTVLPVPTDVIDETSVQRLFNELPRAPDVLVNNAGVSLSPKSIVESDIRSWWQDWVSATKS